MIGRSHAAAEAKGCGRWQLRCVRERERETHSSLMSAVIEFGRVIEPEHFLVRLDISCMYVCVCFRGETMAKK